MMPPPPPPIFLYELPAFWQNFFVGVWVAAIIIAGAYLLLSVVQMRRATSGNVPGRACEAKTHAVLAGSALGGLIGFGGILLAVFAVFS